MSWGNFKTVDGSITFEIGTMDTSKRSLDPVGGSKLPVKVGKDMTADEVRVLAQKKHSDYDQFYSRLENYVLLYPDTKHACLVQMSHLPLRNIKKSLANRIQNISLSLYG